MTSGARIGLFRAGQVAFTLIVLGVVWRLVDGQKAVEVLGSAQPFWVMAGILALTLQTILSALRWRITASQLGLMLPVRLVVREYYLSQIVNQALPGGVLGDAARAARSREQRGLIAASQAVIFERLAGQIALFSILCVAFLTTCFAPGGFVRPAWVVSLILGVLAVGFGTVFICALVVLLPNPLQDKATVLAKTMAHALAGRRVLPAQITLSLATAICNLAAFALCARAVGVTLPPIAIGVLIPLILFTMLVPLTITGWGVREGAAAALLPLAGATSSEGLAASVVFGLSMFAATLPGVFAIWMGRKPQGAST